MGRPRKNNPFNLPPRTYWHHGQFWYVHKSGEWEPLGTDVKQARERGKHLNDDTSQWGLMAWHLDEFLAYFARLVNAGERSERTLSDYRKNIVELKAAFGDFAPHQITSKEVGDYLDGMAEAGRGVVANREKACLSACYTWLRREGVVNENPCAGIRRNKETRRDLYVEDAWVAAVKLAAPRQVSAMLDLVYWTLQRPTDVLTWHGGMIHQKGSGRILRVAQGKTGRTVDIDLTGDLAAFLLRSKGQYFISTGKGEPYTYDGLSAMLKRAIKKAGVPAFGFRDMKGKGATDMWRRGVPIERIQLLCGHKSKQTTEIYIKARWRETATPNVANTADNGQ